MGKIAQLVQNILMPPKVPFTDLCMHILFALMHIDKEKKNKFFVYLIRLIG